MGKIMNYLASSITGGNPSSSLLPFQDFGALDSSNPIIAVVGTVSSFATDVADALGDVTQLAKMAYCIGQAFTNPGMVLGVLDNLAGNLLGVAMDMADRILASMQGQINQAIGQITGTAINAINAAFGFLNAVVDFAEATINLLESIAKLGSGNLEFKVSQEECEFMFAAMAGCMLNQLLGDKLRNFENKITDKITEVGSDINSKIADNLASTNAVSNYVSHQSFLMNKATAQINGINNLIS
jgi:hypothetical protein